MKCSICSGTIIPGRGKMYVKVDGTVLYFCDGTCEKHYKMGRVGKRLKWTTESRKLRPKKAAS